MTLSNKAIQKINDLKDALHNLVQNHANITGSSSKKGHVQAGGVPQNVVSTSGAAGTDNGYYARADHVHKVDTASTTIKGVVQLDSTPTTNSTNAVTSGGLKTALDGKSNTDHTHSNYLTTHQDISGKEDKTNKTSSWNSTTNNTRYPTEKLVKDSLDGKSDTGHTHSNYLTSHQDISGKVDKAQGASNANKNLVTDGSGNITTEAKPTIDTALSSTSTNAVQNKVINTALSGKANSTHNHTKSQITDFPTLATVATSGSYNDLSNKPTLSGLGGTVTVEKQATAETGFIATYVVKQNGAQVGAKINIPKDFLVKSASLKTCTTANNPISGLTVNDPYLDFIINTVGNDGTDSHIYINVKDLVDTYTAGTGLTLTNNAFSVKYGTTAGTACQGNDSRLSDARTPTSHSHGSIANGGTLNSDITSVNKVVVTDSSNNIKTISKLPSANVTHQDISGKVNVSDIETVPLTITYTDDSTQTLDFIVKK